MDKVRKNLTLGFWLPIAACLLTALVYEADLLQPWDGGSVVLEYYLTLVMELVTICLIPPAVRLFRFGGVRRALKADGVAALGRWGMVRLAMLALPMMVNTLLYYQFVSVAFGYMAIIGALSMCFVYPSAERCREETEKID